MDLKGEFAGRWKLIRGTTVDSLRGDSEIEIGGQVRG